MKVKIKRLSENSVIPKYAKPGDAGLDLTATSVKEAEKGYLEYGTGLSIEIPEGYVGLIFPRSSISEKELYLSNSVGVIDSGYRGEIRFRFSFDFERWDSPENPIERDIYKYYESAEDECLKITTDAFIYGVGDRIGQLIILPYPKIEFIEDELSETERGTGGFGSTNKE